MKHLDLIKTMTLAHGPSGFEDDVKTIIKKYLKGKAEFSQDNLGSLICKKEGTSSSPKIMIPGHMDEIGFMVNSITKNGYVKFIPLGGWWDQVLLAQKVIIKTRKGDFTGVIGSTPPHLLSAKDKNKIVEKKEMFIDVGARDREEAQEVMGILPGDPIIPNSTFHILGEKMIMAKAIDNRVGCCLFMNVLEALWGTAHANTVYGVGTVQEEVGLRGATTSAHVVAPDICLTIDVTIATDMPGLEKEDTEIKLGSGPVLTLADATVIGNRSLRNFVLDTAKKNNIPLQYNTMMGGGTDGGAIHKSGSGVPTIVISIPTRYIHSHYSIFHYDDYETTLRLLLSLIQGLDEKTVNNIKGCPV
ncbi:MAG: M42 family metallopeptidase [Clostridia bacterium]|jgi:putative aminopeptidase FrvX|nr:M42 family metallopeptidase [Clostridia bacterium]MDD4146414.1 M42 family metallopeptidase [Clostridia bacterium]MDD4665472.1 M42 family metallopeptidase [Clostridia bacterium]